MIIIKIWYHICCLLRKALFKLIYGRKFLFGRFVTWRKGFSLMIEKNAEVKIGNSCFFNNYCSIAANNSVEIGDGCLFGENVKIYDHNHRFNKKMPIKEQGFSNGEVHIGQNCWIGSNVTILKGANIGDNCVIGAGCVVSGRISAESLVKIDKSSYVTEDIKYYKS